ncbi:short-chain dehydrogenase/reductase SDR [Burkholderia sp. H160]|nr:short-chain dehydrogenase/reductase SDR [Burkholderia sp. H160]
MKHLQGKSIVVTGAGRGIGRAVALELSRQGASVLVNDLDDGLTDAVVRDIRELGGTAASVVGSIADWSIAEKVVVEAKRQFGGLDGFVNNAGLHHACLPWNETPERVQRLVEVNVKGSLYCGIHALKAFVTQRRGSFVNLCSGAHLGVEAQASYAATKGAVASMTYGWALDCMPHGVRVNAIAPLAKTRMTEGLPGFGSTASATGVARAPAVEVPDPETLTPLFVYLLADMSAKVTGQILRFNGSELSAIGHPFIHPLRIAQQGWTAQTMHDALSGPLQAALSQPGLANRLAEL